MDADEKRKKLEYEILRIMQEKLEKGDTDDACRHGNLARSVIIMKAMMEFLLKSIIAADYANITRTTSYN